MWRSKKFIVIALLIAVVLVGSTAGAVLANEDEVGNQPKTRCDALLDRVCAIYEVNTGETINGTALKEAFSQARSEIRDKALDSYLQKQVDKGRMTDDEAIAYKEWLQSKPDVTLPGPSWRFGGHGFHGGMKWGRGHPCRDVPDNTSE